MASLYNIKLLNKRYTSAQWKTGVTVDNQTVIPKLWPGEFGFNTDTKEIRANLSTATPNEDNAVLFKDATIVNFPIPQTTAVPADKKTKKYLQSVELDKGEDGSSLYFYNDDLPEVTIAVDPNDTLKGAGAFITGLRINPNNDHQLYYTTGNHPVSQLDVKASGTNITAAQQTNSTVTVVSGMTGTGDGHKHTITYDTVEVPTTKYVDEKIDDVKIAVGVAGSGNYVSNVETSQDGHKIQVTKATLPTYAGTGTVGTAGNTSTDSATILGAIELSDSVSGTKTTHTISGTSKTIKGAKTTSGNGTITVAETGNVITITLDDEKYALAEDCSMAMVFKGTLASTANTTSGQFNTLSTASKSQVGDTYKVIEDGTYGGVTAEKGDMIICRQIGTGSAATYQWILIESGEDVDKFLTSVNAGKGLTKSGSNLSPTISHEDYSSATDLNGGFVATTGTKTGYGVKGQAVTDIAFDEDGLGHVKTASLSGELELATVDGAIQIAQDYESTTVISNSLKTTTTGDSSDTILIKDDGSGNDHNYTIYHKDTTRTNKTGTAQTPSYGGKFTVVTGVGSNNQGHITEVTTTEITLPASDHKNRAIKVGTKDNAQDASAKTSTQILAASSDTAVDFISGQNIKIAGNSSTGTITISTLGNASSTVQGFVKLGTDTEVATTGKTYAVGVDSQGKLRVAVPWENTDVYGHKNNLADSTYRFAVFKRDKGGHIVEADDIQILDGNYDID